MFLKKYQSHKTILNISNDMDMSLLPPPLSVHEMYIQRLNYQVHSHETSKAFQIWTKCVEINEKEIEYLWVKKNLLVSEKLINILDEQNVERDAD